MYLYIQIICIESRSGNHPKNTALQVELDIDMGWARKQQELLLSTKTSIDPCA